MSLIWFLIIGIVAGWIAGLIVRGGGFGIIIDLIVGIIGAIIGGHVLGWFGVIAFGLIGSLISAIIGAVILLGIVRLIKTA
ncbi:MAG: GlsB/YeaQ/YmgE family stress response membrane protein [Terriglobia bacterium]